MKERQKRIKLKSMQGRQFITKQRIMLEESHGTKKIMQEMRAYGRQHCTREKESKKVAHQSPGNNAKNSKELGKIACHKKQR